MRRIGIACGVDEVEVALSANALLLYLPVMNDHFVLRPLKLCKTGINTVITDIQRRVYHDGESDPHRILAYVLIQNISPERYNCWLVVVMIGPIFAL